MERKKKKKRNGEGKGSQLNSLLLHLKIQETYNNFSVETIDTFFHIYEPVAPC